jgi:hypothetical protein
VGFGLSARTGPPRELLVVGGSPLKGNSYHLIQPIFFFEFSRQVGFRQILKVLVGQRVELELESGRGIL